MNNKKFKLIGVAGLAGAGKNTFSTLLIEKFKSHGISYVEKSFAFYLREELAPILRENFGFDVWTQDRKKKEIFRNFLVLWAEMRRKMTSGCYFIKKLKQDLDRFTTYTPSYVIVTDTRFKEYPYDEVDFIKQNGVLVHISAYKEKNGEREFITPPNASEAKNDPIVRGSADYMISWPIVGKDNTSLLDKHVDDFFIWL